MPPSHFAGSNFQTCSAAPRFRLSNFTRSVLAGLIASRVSLDHVRYVSMNSSVAEPVLECMPKAVGRLRNASPCVLQANPSQQFAERGRRTVRPSFSPVSRKDNIGKPLASNPDPQSFDRPLIHDRDSPNRLIILQSPCRIETNVDCHLLEIDVLNLQAADLSQTRTCAS